MEEQRWSHCELLVFDAQSGDMVTSRCEQSQAVTVACQRLRKGGGGRESERGAEREGARERGREREGERGRDREGEREERERGREREK